jgi:UDP-N-acetylglucosamine 1-carboxyvinyltransferase
MPQQMVIEGGCRLQGEVSVSGSKNAVLPILAATLLTREQCVIRNVPYLADVETLVQILRSLGADIKRREDGAMVCRVVDESAITAPYELVKQMRASICVLGSLIGKRHSAKVSMPGGCVIGVRPIDLHLKGLRALGTDIRVDHGYIDAYTPHLRGNEIFLGGNFGSSVLGTANVMTAAVLAEGTSVIEYAACEPEVEDLAHFLISMGARISGVGSHHLVIEGVKELHGSDYAIIPDRIETGTWMAAAAMTQGDIVIKNVKISHLGAVIDKFREVGVGIVTLPEKTATGLDQIRVTGKRGYHAAELVTLPYPGFPTDLQAQFCSLFSLAEGISVITEKIFPDRFMHVAELSRMGARMYKEGPSVIIYGVDALSGAPVMASDLRASAALILAGLAARGQTTLDRLYHLDRGYENLDSKLQQLGARTRRVAAEEKKANTE